MGHYFFFSFLCAKEENERGKEQEEEQVSDLWQGLPLPPSLRDVLARNHELFLFLSCFPIPTSVLFLITLPLLPHGTVNHVSKTAKFLSAGGKREVTGSRVRRLFPDSGPRIPILFLLLVLGDLCREHFLLNPQAISYLRARYEPILAHKLPQK